MIRIKKSILFCLFLIIIIGVHNAKADTEMSVKPSGDVHSRMQQELRHYSDSNMEPTGLYMKKGDKITISASNVSKAKVFLGLMGRYNEWNDGKSNVYEELDLQNGTNEFTMDYEVGEVYIENLSETDTIKVSITGGRSNPIYKLGQTNDKDFINSLKNNTDAPFFELVGDHTHCLFRCSTNNIDALTGRDSVKSFVEELDNVVVDESACNGLFYGDPSTLGINHKYDNRMYIYEGETNTVAAATDRHMVLSSTATKNLLQSTSNDDEWTIWHEIGHTFQNPCILWGSDGDNGVYPFYNNNEVTANINSLYMENKKGLQGRLYGDQTKRKSLEKYLALSNNGKDYDTTSQGDFKPATSSSLWIKVCMYNQLMIAYGFDIFSYVNQEYRTMHYTGETMPSTNEEKRQCFMKIVSMVTKRNLEDYFEKWGLHPNDATKKEMGKYSKPSVKIEDNLLPGNDTAIEDKVLPPLEIPTGIVKKAKFILGAQPDDFKISDLFDTTTLKNYPSGASITPTYKVQVVNDLLNNSTVTVKITNAQGQSNIFNVPLEKSYGNAISMEVWHEEERAIFTLQKKTKTLDTFTDEARTTVLGYDISFKLIGKNGVVKKVATCGTNEAPQEFVHSLRNIPYEEGDIVILTNANAGKIQSYKEGTIDFKRSDSTKQECFKIENDQFVHVSDSDPTLTVGNSHLLYEKDEVLSEDELFKEGQVSTESGNQLSSDFTSELSKTLGEHTVTVTATNPATGTKVSKTLTISIVDPSLVLKGSIGFIDDTNQMIINQPKEVHIAISGEAGSSTVKSLKLVHQFGSDHLSLGKTINQKLPGQEWESQGIDPNEPLTLSLDQMNADESFEAKYDIIASEALSNKQGDQWHINYSYVNKVDGVEKTYTKTLDLSLDTETIDVPDNGGASQLQKKGMITFQDDNQPTYPVDPVNPVQPIVPDQPINPNGAELMITYASDLNFGKQSKSETSWHALADSVKDQVNSASSRSVVPFISVKDSRGTNRNGWKLEVTKDDDFKDDEGDILKGADLTYSNLNYADQINIPVATSGSVTLSQSASVIAQADSTQGAGNTSLALGRLGENDQTSGVTLSVLPGTLINTKTYRTTITYELVAGL